MASIEPQQNIEELKLTKANLKEYQDLCKFTSKKFEKKEDELINWGLGISGEAGDVASCIKKTIFHENDQTAGIRENLGDTMWYIAMICNYFGWDLEEVLAENVAKLHKRYPKGFTIKDAQRNGTMIDWNENEIKKNKK